MLSPQRSKSLLCIANEENEENEETNEQLKHEVFIGNLNYKVPTRSIIDKLQQLFDSVGVNVPDFRFTIFQRKSKKSAVKYGFVLLSNENEEELVYQLNGLSDVDIITKGHKLKLQSRENKTNRTNTSARVSFGTSLGLSRVSKSIPNLNTVNISSDSSRISIDHKPYNKEFCYGQLLPCEDRVTEYKRGAGKYLKKSLVPTIRKYICAFLNSEGGHLLIGVDDNCKVYGICCDREEEDLARCMIDNTIKQFQPHVLPNTYVVDFIPVKLSYHDKIEASTTDPLLKVLEVSVKKPMGSNVLYENDKGQVFVRRDGSIEGPLKATQIVEWCRINFTSTLRQAVTDKHEDTVLARESFSSLRRLNNLEDIFRKGQRRLEGKLDEMQRMLEYKQNNIILELERKERVAFEGISTSDVSPAGITLICNIL